jgi:hypothetical protein
MGAGDDGWDVCVRRVWTKIKRKIIRKKDRENGKLNDRGGLAGKYKDCESLGCVQTVRCSQELASDVGCGGAK